MIGDIEDEKLLKREQILAMRELTAELKGVRNEMMRFNLLISNISQKAGQIGSVKALIDLFLNQDKKT